MSKNNNQAMSPCPTCGQPKRPRYLCEECRTRKAAEKLQHIIATVPRIQEADYTGDAIYDEQSERYFYGDMFGELAEYYADEEIPLPVFVRPVRVCRANLCVDSIVEMEGEAYNVEDDYDGMSAEAKAAIVQFVSKWNEKHARTYYMPDESRIIWLDEDRT